MPTRELAFDLLNELYVRSHQRYTSRIERFRSREVIAAWVDEQLRAFGDGAYWTMTAAAKEWRAGQPPAHAGAAGLFRFGKEDMPPDWVLLLSGDEQRALVLTWIPGLDFLYAVALPVAEVLAIRAAHFAIDRLVSEVDAITTQSYPPLDHRIDAEACFAGEPDLTLPAAASAERRDTWLADCLGRFRQRFALDDEYYFASLTCGRHAPWSHFRAREGWLGALWRAGEPERLLILDGDEKGTLALMRAGRYEARLRPTL